MREIIRVKVDVCKGELSERKTDMLAVGVFSDVQKPDKSLQRLDEKLGGAIAQLRELGDFKGKKDNIAVLYGNEKTAAKRILLLGLGEKKNANADTARKAAMIAANKSVEMKADKLSLGLHQVFGRRPDARELASAITEGIYFGGYRYDEYVSENEDGRSELLNVELIEPDAKKVRILKKGVAEGAITGAAQSYARTLENRPGNVINPDVLAKEAKKMIQGIKGLGCTVFDEKQLKQKGMGGILAVGSGSENKPRLIVLNYSPAGAAKNRPTIGLVGKAITFDSGGLNVKAGNGMEQMKLDKSGGIGVLATMKAIAELGLKLNVCGIIPAAENMPSGSSYRPGDIVATYSGKSVEVLNTDAEGRMVLCDGLAYAVEQKCDIIIDIATLTGACMVALGKYKAGLMGNDNKLIKELQKVSEQSGEMVWHMPSGPEYAEEIKGKIADLKNIGSKWGGACTAAAFLGNFVGDKKWAHLDIAGMDMFDKGKQYSAPGASGFGVRLLTRYLMTVAR